jgi:hypothetical protein
MIFLCEALHLGYVVCTLRNRQEIGTLAIKGFVMKARLRVQSRGNIPWRRSPESWDSGIICATIAATMIGPLQLM